MATQACPACGAANDVSIYINGKRIACRACGLHFIVQRSDSILAPAAVLRQAHAPVVAKAAASQAVAAVPPPKPAGDTRPGGAELNVPGFTIHEMLGKGGMGRVYRARQLSLDRWVAIKILNEDLAKHHSFVRRFEKESGALAALNHPNITAIYDRGHHGNLYYFVMEYVGGPSLRGKMQEGLSIEESLNVFRTLCGAVGHAHQRSVIHRDLKPENVLFSEEGVLKVADFGLANIVAPDRRWELTRTRVSMGTVNYMAPEQRRDAKHVDHRADIYSLGVMLYEMLTGELPVGRFPPPSQLRRGVDPRIDRIVMRMLDAEVERRPQNATLVAVTVGEILAEGRAAVAEPPAPATGERSEPISARSTEPPSAPTPQSPAVVPPSPSPARPKRRSWEQLLRPALGVFFLLASASAVLWWLFHRHLADRPGDMVAEHSGAGYAVKVVHLRQITYISPQRTEKREGRELVVFDFLSSSQSASRVMLNGGVWWKEKGRFIEDSCAKGFAVNQVPARALFGEQAIAADGVGLLARVSTSHCLVADESGARLSLESFGQQKLGGLSLVLPLKIVRRAGLGFLDAEGRGVELSLPADGQAGGWLIFFEPEGESKVLPLSLPTEVLPDSERVLELFFQQGQLRARIDGIGVLEQPLDLPTSFRGFPALSCQNSRCEFGRLEIASPPGPASGPVQ